MAKLATLTGYRLGRTAHDLIRAFGGTGVSYWLLLGLLIRLLLMPATMHNDTVWMPWMANQVVEGHLNVYQYLLDTYGDRTLRPVVWAPYMPLYYYVTAGWTGLLKVLGVVDVGTWSFDAQKWTIPYLHRGIVLMKLLYLPFDVVVGWSLGRMVQPSRRVIAWCLWSLSPIILVSVYMMGQNDLMPTALVVLATLVGLRAVKSTGDGVETNARLAYFSTFLLGVAAAFKTYPLFLVLPFSLTLGQRRRDVMALTLVGVAPFAAIIAPFLSSRAFRLGVILNPEAQRIFAAMPGIGPAGVSPFVVGYTVLIAYLVYQHSSRGGIEMPLPSLAFVTLGLMFATSNWAFYWLVWLVPFATWMVVTYPDTYLYAVGYVAVFLIWTWNWGNRASSGLFSPVYAGAMAIPAVQDLTNRFYSWQESIVIVQSVFVGLLICHGVVAWRSPLASTIPGDERILNSPRPYSGQDDENVPSYPGIHKRDLYDDFRPLPGIAYSLALFAAWIAASFVPALVRF